MSPGQKQQLLSSHTQSSYPGWAVCFVLGDLELALTWDGHLGRGTLVILHPVLTSPCCPQIYQQSGHTECPGGSGTNIQGDNCHAQTLARVLFCIFAKCGEIAWEMVLAGPTRHTLSFHLKFQKMTSIPGWAWALLYVRWSGHISMPHPLHSHDSSVQKMQGLWWWRWWLRSLIWWWLHVVVTVCRGDSARALFTAGAAIELASNFFSFVLCVNK